MRLRRACERLCFAAALGALLLGVILFVGVVVSMGPPYPDGPNAGWVNPPGYRRSVETLLRTYGFALTFGVLLLSGLANVLVVGFGLRHIVSRHRHS